MCPAIDILVVDDESTIVDMLVDLFTELELSTRVARNGAQALQVIQECSPALILLDLAMPVMDGYSLLQSLREHGYPELPIIVMSAATVLDYARLSGATHILAKPFDLDDLLHCIRPYISLP